MTKLPFSRKDIELRLNATKHARDVVWKKDGRYTHLLDLDIWALELALEHVIRHEQGSPE
jgi:hypothetical protein